MDIYAEIMKLRQAGRPAVVVTVVACRGACPSEPQSKMLVDAKGLVAGTVGGGAIEKMALADARQVLEGREPRLEEYVLDEEDPRGRATPTGMVCGGRMTLFFELVGAGDRAYLIGAGHVNRALAAALAPLGFEVVFVDYRAEQLAELDVPYLTAGEQYGALPELPRLADSYVVVATHGHACDEEVIAQLLARDERPRYLGVVASRRKRKEMLPRLRERLGDDAPLDQLFMPVGLHLGGNAPAALALSIAAEMQSFRHGIDGHVHMRDRRPRPAEEESP